MKYRSDVDGLRTLAVLPVVLAHAGIGAMEGGFIGVDVFFVISGFLITRILADDLDAGTYSLAGFYERRARRILPALIFMIVAIYPFAWWLMLPDFLQNFGQSVVATLLFSNNLLLALTSGYWALESAFKPLLHTWSLGVEEQFYIIFPLLLAAVWRFGRRAQITMICALAVISLGLAEHGWRTDPAVSYYLPTTRAWELMAGCLAAYVPRRERRADNALSLLGLLAIVVPVFAFGHETPAPSLYIAIPVAGAVLVLLFSRPGTLAHGLLSLRPMVALGLISYSTYLWHQPLFALTRVALPQPPSLPLMLGLSVLSIALGWFSWRFVEHPFRSRRTMPLRRFAVPLASASVILVASGMYLHVTQGLPKRIFPNIEASGDVYIGYNERIRDFTADSFPADASPRVLVLGNSFGRDIANTLLETGRLAENSLVYHSVSPHWLQSNPLPDTVRALMEEADLVVTAIHGGPVDENLAGIEQMAGIVQGRFLVFGTKHFGLNLNPYGRVPPAQRAATRSAVPEDVLALDSGLEQALADDLYIDVLDMLGEDGRSVAVFDADGNPLSPDRIHLTRYGARFLAKALERVHPGIVDALDAPGPLISGLDDQRG